MKIEGAFSMSISNFLYNPPVGHNAVNQTLSMTYWWVALQQTC